ncbi:hypothetical protein [Helicobacter felis]|uniref:hypothetical protein n=1 Tax=Helicobacter felis TaxID=214 RepID=UPI00131573E7|nr:hypothetical protein [Helicobacter felis]
MVFGNNQPQSPAKYQQYKAEIEAIKKSIEEKQVALMPCKSQEKARTWDFGVQ